MHGTFLHYRQKLSPETGMVPGLFFMVGKELKKVRRLAPSLSKLLTGRKLTKYYKILCQPGR